MSERAFWDRRYRLGGDSGRQSEGPIATWKWSVIDSYSPSFASVIDYGCGDLRFIKGRRFGSYLGVDVSSEIVMRNRRMRPDLRFEYPQWLHEKADTVLCIDVLFHQSTEAGYSEILHALRDATLRHLFIHTWIINPLGRGYAGELIRRGLRNYAPSLILRGARRWLLPSDTDGVNLYYRRFEDYLRYLKPLELQGIHENPNQAGAMYVFRLDR